MYSTTGIEASNYVSTYNTAFYFIAGVSLFLLIGLTLTMLYFVYRYNKKRNPVATQIEGNTALEITWTVIPLILALVMFSLGWAGWKPTTKPPKDAMNITAVARMWNFLFLYENGKQSPDLIVPLNTPVKIKLISLDVIHSLFIPDFRIKSDIIPGREKYMWFLPEVEGKYKIFCAEYCGLQHSYMHSTVNVMSQEKFKTWYAESASPLAVAGNATPADIGEAIMRTQGCFACHTSDGTKLIGPSYLNIYGSQQVVIRDGKEVTITVDPAYVKRSILEPNADITKGFPANLMQSYRNTISDDDIAKIIEYLKSLNDK
jgi:cytochrome c oxidase subunit II